MGSILRWSENGSRPWAALAHPRLWEELKDPEEDSQAALFNTTRRQHAALLQRVCSLPQGC